MLKIKNVLLLAFAIITNVCVFAQNEAATASGQPTGFMRSEAKIYVVMVVVITILVALLAYLVRLDTKISHLEKSENI